MTPIYILFEGRSYDVLSRDTWGGRERFMDFHVHSCYLDRELAKAAQEALPNSYIEKSQIVKAGK